MVFLNFLHSKTTILPLSADKKTRKSDVFLFFHKFVHSKTTKLPLKRKKMFGAGGIFVLSSLVFSSLSLGRGVYR